MLRLLNRTVAACVTLGPGLRAVPLWDVWCVPLHVMLGRVGTAAGSLRVSATAGQHRMRYCRAVCAQGSGGAVPAVAVSAVLQRRFDVGLARKADPPGGPVELKARVDPKYSCADGRLHVSITKGSHATT